MLGNKEFQRKKLTSFAELYQLKLGGRLKSSLQAASSRDMPCYSIGVLEEVITSALEEDALEPAWKESAGLNGYFIVVPSLSVPAGYSRLEESQ